MDIRIMAVGSAKLNRSGGRRPRIRLAGFWLEDIGFGPDSLVTAQFGEGSIELRPHGKGVDAYSRIVKQVRETHSCLLQVRNELHNRKRVPHFEVKGLWLEEYGFVTGSVIAVRYSFGYINVKLLDMGKLGI
jgi:hypothetical protein